jgi:hypothetical protein
VRSGLLAILGSLVTGGAPQTISLGERATAVVAVVIPAGAEVRHGSSERIRAFADELVSRTDLDPVSPERAGIDLSDLLACRDTERLQCWVKTARAGSSTTSKSVEYLLVVSVKPLGPEEAVSLLAIDVSLAEDVLGDPSDPEEIESAIFARAVRVHAGTLPANDAEAFEAHVRELVEREIRPLSARRDHGRPLGIITLRGPRAGLSLWVDRRLAGEVSSATVEIRDIAPGTRKVELRDRATDFTVYASEITVTSGGRHSVDVVLIDPPRQPTATNRALFYGGILLSAGGAALIIAALASSPAAASVAVCPGGACEEKERSFASFCELGADDVHACDGSKTPLVAPLGIALWAAGATFTMGSELESDGVPWISSAVGLGLAVLAYGLGAALD